MDRAATPLGRRRSPDHRPPRAVPIGAGAGAPIRLGGGRTLVAFAIGLAAAACIAANASDLRHFVNDDGAISLRYAERISSGLGFGYNDGEAVNGASDPLYVLAAAALMRLGLEPGAAVRVLGAGSLALATAILGTVLARRYSLAAGGLALALLWRSESLHASSFNGLESAFTLLLVCLAFAAFHAKRPLLHGLALGLLVQNKLDGALAALAYAAVFAAGRRRFPARTALAALLCSLPLAALLVLRFGSVVPNSGLTKVFEHSSEAFDRAWMMREIWEKTGAWPLLLAAAAALTPASLRSLPVATLSLWTCLHVLAYSLLDLGDTYPWYTVEPQVAVVILAGVLVARLEGQALSRFTTAGGKALRRARVAGAGLAGACLLWAATSAALRTSWWSAGGASGGVEIPAYAQRDLARSAAGAWLRRETSGTELLATLFGLPAFEYKGPVYDHTGLNSKRDAARGLTAAYYVLRDTGSLPPEVADVPIRARFVYGVDAAGYLVLARPGTELAREGACHFLHRVDRWAVHAGEEPVGALQRGPSWIELAPGERGSFEVDLECAGELRVASIELPASSATEPGVEGGAAVRIEADGRVVLDLRVQGRREGPWIVPLEAGRRRLEWSVESRAQARGERVLFRGVSLRAGEALRAADFSLLCPRWARRIDAFAERGFVEPAGAGGP